MRDYDQDPIIVYTQYSYEQAKEFQRVHCRKYRKRAIIILIFGLIVMARMIIITHMGGYNHDVPYLLLLSLVIIYQVYRILAFNAVFYTQAVYMRYVNEHRGNGHYQFMNNHYITTGEDGDYKTIKDAPYDDVQMIVETDTVFYLYTSPVRAHIISKAKILNDFATPEELSDFLREKFKDAKYERA